MTESDDGFKEHLVKHGIRDIEVRENPEGSITELSFAFGPHFFVNVINENGNVSFTLGATHHGMTLDASEVGGELERAMGVMSTICKPENQT